MISPKYGTLRTSTATFCISIDGAPTAGRSVAMTLPSRMSTTLPPCTANAPPAELTHRPPLAPISSATAAEPGAAAIL